jgi:hypothetical protein
LPELNELNVDDKRNTRARFEQWVKNPQCEANALSAVLNVKMSEVATSAGYQPEFGQSPFAITRGLQFEGWLFKENAKVLHSALVKVSLLSENESGLLDLRLTMNGGPKLKSIDAAITESHKLLSNLSEKGNFSPPSIIAGLALRIPKGVMLPEATLIIDAAIISKSQDKFSIKVGEIKVFPDRGGHTDPGEIATARAQAGVYQHALDLTVKSLNLKNPPIVDTKGFLVFTWPGTNSPVIRPNEDLTFQALRAEQGFERLDEIALRLVSEKAESDSATDSLAWVLHSKTEYRESCWSFCDLAARCQDLAIADDRAIVLGREAARTLGSVKIARAIELMDGATANTAFEVSLQTQLQSANWEALNT